MGSAAQIRGQHFQGDGELLNISIRMASGNKSSVILLAQGCARTTLRKNLPGFCHRPIRAWVRAAIGEYDGPISLDARHFIRDDMAQPFGSVGEAQGFVADVVEHSVAHCSQSASDYTGMRGICRTKWHLQDAVFCGQPRQASPPVIAVTALEDMGCGYQFDRPRVKRATLGPIDGGVTLMCDTPKRDYENRSRINAVWIDWLRR